MEGISNKVVSFNFVIIGKQYELLFLEFISILIFRRFAILFLALLLGNVAHNEDTISSRE